MSGAEFAARLLAVREGAPLLAQVPEAWAPQTAADAYRVADLLVGSLAARWGDIGGYKVGATSVQGQQLLKLQEPFYGRVFARWIRRDATWSLGKRFCSLEPEVGFLMARDLPPRDADYTEAEVRSAIGHIMPLFEVNSPSFARPFEVGGPALIADNGVTQGLVVGGPGVAHIPAQLADETVRLTRNGIPCGEGSAASILGDPIRSIVWLANALRRQSRGLCAGQVVASGALTPHVAMDAGDAFAAQFSTLGRVDCQVVGPRG